VDAEGPTEAGADEAKESRAHLTRMLMDQEVAKQTSRKESVPPAKPRTEKALGAAIIP
jgi:hypothetical protein